MAPATYTLPLPSTATAAKVGDDVLLAGAWTHWADLATVTTQVAVLLPSWVETIILALPEPTVVTTADEPVATIVATVVSLLDQFTLELVAFAGVTVAVSETLSPMPSVAAEGFNATPITKTTTATVQVAVLPPSAVVAVITAVPTATALTTPELETVATLASLVDQATERFVALVGRMLAAS
jgi:hypothetical protein